MEKENNGNEMGTEEECNVKETGTRVWNIEPKGMEQEREDKG